MDNDIRLMLDDATKYLNKELDLWVTHEKDNLHFCLVVVKVVAELEKILGMLCEAWEDKINREIDMIKETQK